MKCPKCKRVIEDHSTFCEYCGYKLKKSPWPWIALAAAAIVGVIIAIVISNNHKQLAIKREENSFFNSCQTAGDFRIYLSRYPNGQYATMARNKVEELKQDSIRQQLDLRAAERNAYENCASQKDCKAYLQKYPRGEFVNQVREILNRLQQDSLNLAQKLMEEQLSSSNQYESYHNNNSSNTKTQVSTSNGYDGNTRYVVIDGTLLRLRLGPSTSYDTFKWPDGTNRHPDVGDKFRYLGESGDFYKIDFKGNQLWVSKDYSHIEWY